MVPTGELPEGIGSVEGLEELGGDCPGFGNGPPDLEEITEGLKDPEPPPHDPELVLCSIFNLVCVKHDPERPCTHNLIPEEGQLEPISPERARELVRQGTDVMNRAFRPSGIKFCSNCDLPIIAGKCLGNCDS